MNKLLAIIAAIAAVTVTAQAEPETRRAIPVHQKESATMPAEPQTRRAIPVAQAAIDAEMQAAAEATANPAPTPAGASVDHGVGANVLWRKYDQNPIAADSKYRGIIRIVTGTVKDIGRDILGSPYIVLGDGRISGGVQCVFNTDDEAAITELRKGQMVAIRGEIRGLIFLSVLVRDCQFVEMPPLSEKQRDAGTPMAQKARGNPAVPSEVMSEIRDKAAMDWPGNYAMQRYEIKRQVEAYLALHE